MKKIYLLLLILVTTGSNIFAQFSIEMLKEINPGTNSSFPTNFIEYNSKLYFKADNGSSGEELWVSDGTLAGTQMLKDIYPGANGSFIASFTEYNGKLYFNASNGTTGYELWVTDGTSAGTQMLKDINPTSGSNPSQFTQCNGKLYFSAYHPSYGYELWVTDGTSAGTQMIKDINPGTGNSELYILSEYNGKIYFQAYNAATGIELWVSDGTTAGTLMLKDINPGTGPSYPKLPIIYNGKLYFNAETNSTGAELWVTDGTTEGTQMIKDIRPGEEMGFPRDFTEFNGKLYFAAFTDTSGNELWVTDGTSEGTQILKDIYPGAASSDPTHFIEYNGKLYFSANDGTSGEELWVTDGTNEGTQIFNDIRPGINGSSPDCITEYHGKLYFKAYGNANGNQIWTTDGTPGSMQMLVPDIAPLSNPLSDTNELYVYDHALYYSAKYNTDGQELYKLTATPNYTTWDGSIWDYGSPNLTMKAIINGDLTIDENLEARELEITPNGSLIIPDGFSFTVDGKITNNAAPENFVVQNDGNLIQIQETLENTGEITVYQNSQGMVRNDMTLWSSPVIEQGLRAFSPETLFNRFWEYDEANTTYKQLFDSNEAPDINFEPGRGYAVRVRNTLPPGQEETVEGKFTGVPFNGNNPRWTPKVQYGYNLIGNPYPSNISLQGAGNFLDVNASVEAIYFWAHQYPVGSPNYDNNYVAFTNAGSTMGDIEYISKGQGFFVKVGYSSIIMFNNSMRTPNAAYFYKGSNQRKKHRIWLSISDNEQVANRLLIAYMDGATEGFDHQIDAKLFGTGSTLLYNLIDEEKCAIQGRPLPFSASDIVPLGMKISNPGRYHISLEDFDGLFSEGNVTIYLKDNELEITHNLMESDYEFESRPGEFNHRFEIVYRPKNKISAAPSLTNNVRIYKNDNEIVAQSEKEKILSVGIYNLQGRVIYDNQNVNELEFKINSDRFEKGILVVKTQTENGEVQTKKIINN